MVKYTRLYGLCVTRIGLGALVAAVCAAAWPGAAQAQHREEAAGRVGSAQIIRIFGGANFHRCSAHFENANRDVLRIAMLADRKYWLSIPPTAIRHNEPPTIAVTANGSGTYASSAFAHSGRWVTTLPANTIERMMDFRGPLIVRTRSARYEWNLGTSVENVLVAIENCTNRASGWR
jgi:hypothetical protein